MRASFLRRSRQLERCFTTHSSRALSKPMSLPAFSLSIHLCFKISARSARNSQNRARIGRANRSVYLTLHWAMRLRRPVYGRALRICSAILLNSAVTGDRRSSFTIGIPRSPASRVAMSIGI